MQPRLHIFAQALRSSRIWARTARPSARPLISQFVCRNCQSKFSTSSILRQAREVLRSAARKNGGKDQKYPSHLVIYNAGDMRTSFVAFWKATAIFQFGVVAVFLAPVLYRNENQPDPNVRLLQAVGLTVLGAIPMALMSYLTTPFVKKVALEIPAYAQRSRDALLHFSSRGLHPETRLEFTTLRAFPIERKTAVFLFELQALKPQWWRFANISRAKTPEWRRRQALKPWYSRIIEIINEPRFKFYVKEGRSYTVKSGVPGVWEDVARAIRRQTVAAGSAESGGKGAGVTGGKGAVGAQKTVGSSARGLGERRVGEVAKAGKVAKSVRRQTSRSKPVE